jgi:hypothetical protein
LRLPVTPLSMAVLADLRFLAARLLVEAHAQQFHLHLLDIIRLRCGNRRFSRRPAESSAR